jgi:hypothetical protein
MTTRRGSIGSMRAEPQRDVGYGSAALTRAAPSTLIDIAASPSVRPRHVDSRREETARPEPLSWRPRRDCPLRVVKRRNPCPSYLCLLFHHRKRTGQMIGMSHFPTGGSIASLTRFSIFLFSSLGPLCPLLSNSWARAFCAFGTASINSASASLKPEAA